MFFKPRRPHGITNDTKQFLVIFVSVAKRPSWFVLSNSGDLRSRLLAVSRVRERTHVRSGFRAAAGAVVLGAALLAGCGKKGPPLTPIVRAQCRMRSPRGVAANPAA